MIGKESFPLFTVYKGMEIWGVPVNRDTGVFPYLLISAALGVHKADGALGICAIRELEKHIDSISMLS